MANTDVNVRLLADSRSLVAGVGQAQASLEKMAGAVARVGHYGVALGLVLPQLTAIVRGTTQAADAFANLSARIKITSEGLGSAAIAQSAIFDIAQRTRQSVEAVADGYGKLANVGKELGLSQQDVLRTTETLSKAMALGGGSAQSQQAALLQLGQALGQGVLRGDEFNSVMEQAPGLAKLLADSLGVPTGALRAMAEQGRLTSQIIIGALSESAGKIDTEFGKLPPTIGGALTQLGNSFMQTIGLMDQAGGVSQKAAAGIKAVADNMGIALGTTAALGAGMLVLRTSTTAAAASVAALRAGLGFLGGPIGLVATLLTGGAAAWVAWKAAGVEGEKAVETQVKESHEEIIARINAQIAALEERNRKAAAGVPSVRDTRAEQAGAIYAELETKRQRAMAGSDEFAGMDPQARAALVAALTRQVGEAYRAYVGAAKLAADESKAAGDRLVTDAGKTVQLDVDLKRKWVEEAAQIARAYTQAIEDAAGDQDRVAALTLERDQRLIEGQRQVNEKLVSMAQAAQAKRLALADAGSALSLAQAKADTDARLGELEDREIAVENRRAQGLIGERQAAEESLAIERERLALKAGLVRVELDLEAARQTPVGDAAAAKQQEARLVALRAQLAALAAQARQAGVKFEGKTFEGDDPGFDPLREAERKFTDAADALWERRWQSAMRVGEQLRDANAQLNVDLIQDDEKRARAQLALDVERLRQSLDLEALTDDQRKQRSAELDQYLVARNRQLAEQFKPGWQKMVEGWADSQRLMRETADQAMSGLLRDAENAWVQFAQTGKTSARTLVNSLIAEFARLQFRSIVGGNGLLGWLQSLAKYGGSSSDVSAPNYENSFDLMNGKTSAGTLKALAVAAAQPTVGAAGKNAAAASAAAPGVSVVVNNSAPGVQATARETTTADGRRTVEVLVDQVRSAIAGDIARGRGPVSSAMQRTYGLNRAAGAY